MTADQLQAIRERAERSGQDVLALLSEVDRLSAALEGRMTCPLCEKPTATFAPHCGSCGAGWVGRDEAIRMDKARANALEQRVLAAEARAEKLKKVLDKAVAWGSIETGQHARPYWLDEARAALSSTPKPNAGHPNGCDCDRCTGKAPKWCEPTTSVVCTNCNDTHEVLLREQMVPCQYCPVPCEKCRQHLGAYCQTTPCTCECHRKAKP